MLQDVDRIGPELILMVAAACVLLTDLVLRDRDRGWLPFGALAGLGASVIWAGVLMARDREGIAFSGTYSLDTFSIFFKFIFIGVAGLVILASADYVRRLRYQGEFWALLLLATSGMMLLAGARDLMLIFIALELTSISQYILAAILKDDRASEAGLAVLGLGGTAVGTGLTAHPRFRRLVVRELGRIVGRRLVPARNPVAATWSLAPLLACSAALRACAVDLGKICFDLRLLASGPDTGLAEIRLPEVLPGSSIMPGKVNPSVPEAVQMVCLQVRAHDHAVALGAAAGELELNVMTPLVAANLGEGFELLTRGLRLLRTRCVDGLAVDRRRARELTARSLVPATALSPYLGYDVTAAVVAEARAAGRPLREVVVRHGLVPPRVLARLLSPRALTGPRPTDVALRRRLQAAAAYRAFRARLSR